MCSMCDVGRITSKPYSVGGLPNLESGLENSAGGARHRAGGGRDFCKAPLVKTATEVGVRAIQDHKVIEWNTCWKCRLSEGTGDK